MSKNYSPANSLLYFEFKALEFDCSDDRVAAVDLGLIPSLVKPMALKFWYSQLACLTLSINGAVWKTSRQATCAVGKALRIFPSWCGRQMAGNS